MVSESQQLRGHDNTLSRLGMAIDALNFAKDVCSFPPAQAAFGAAGALLATTRVRGLRFRGDGFPAHVFQDSMANKQDYLELGLNCADICRALARGMNGKRHRELSRSVCDAINQLAKWVKASVP